MGNQVALDGVAHHGERWVLLVLAYQLPNAVLIMTDEQIPQTKSVFKASKKRKVMARYLSSKLANYISF